MSFKVKLYIKTQIKKVIIFGYGYRLITKSLVVYIFDKLGLKDL